MKYCNDCQSNNCICLELDAFFKDTKGLPRSAPGMFDTSKFFSEVVDECLECLKLECICVDKIPRFNQ